VKLSQEERALFGRIGSLGGKARAKSLTRAERVSIAKNAVKARWDRVKADKAREKVLAS
jgi:hypothetical protein